MRGVKKKAPNRPGSTGGNINNRSLFWSLTLIFCIYSTYVWTIGTAAPQSSTATEQVRHGQKLYQESNCVACHQFYGLGGYMGPDLTNIISSKGAAYASAFLSGGTERMPNFGFSDQEIKDLISFLEFVDTMGIYQAPAYKLSWYGTAEAINE